MVKLVYFYFVIFNCFLVFIFYYYFDVVGIKFFVYKKENLVEFLDLYCIVYIIFINNIFDGC